MAIPLPSIQLFRSARVVVSAAGVPVFEAANTDDQGYRIVGKVTKTLRPEPNTGTVSIMNLEKVKRDALAAAMALVKAQEIENRTVEIFVGYGAVPESLYRGQIAEIRNLRQGPNWTTEIRGSFDGYNADMNVSLVGGIDVATIVKIAAAATGGELSTLDADIARALPGSKVAQTLNGQILVGPASEVLNEAVDNLNATWWEDDGKIHLVPAGQFTTDFAIVLNPNTGLLEEPVLEEADRVTVRALLNPKLRPGRQVILQNELLVPFGSGVFRADRVDSQFDTNGGEWTQNARMQPATG